MSHQKGLLHLFGARVVERIPWARLGRTEPASLYCMMQRTVAYGLDF